MIDVQEICQKLKPILGEKADQYWLAYLAEDAVGKRELADALQMIAIQLLGTNLENPQVHLSVPPKSVAKGEYLFGNVTYAGNTLHSFGLRESEWLQHIAIFGRSGAGKTNTVFRLIKNLQDHKKPFLIFDWKRNYRDLLTNQDEKIFVYTVGGPASPFAFNPLIPPKGVDPAIWLKKLIEIIAHAYFLGEGVMYLFQEAIHSVYKKYGVYKGNNKSFPTFLDVHYWLEKHPVKGRKGLWMDSAIRGIKSICFGPMGKVVNTSVQSNLAALIEKNVILELDRLTNADKTLIVESLMLWVHHYRMGEPERETFKHSLIIEEAHHILRKSSKQGGETITETILREIRELGEAIIIIDQHPSMISPVALGNTYTTICLNLKHRSDVNAMGSAMLMDTDERVILGTLPVGTAVIKLQDRWHRPFQITIPYQKIEKGAVTDENLSKLMAEKEAPKLLGLTGLDGSKSFNGVIELSPKEQKFLSDVITHPFSGIVERYKRLHMSRRKGNTIKEKCLKKNLIEAVTVLTRTGKVVLLQFTGSGRRLLRNTGLQVKQSLRHESLVHGFWKQRAAKHYESLGYNVSEEEPVNGYTDLVIEKNGDRFAIEIETGKSNWLTNVRKNIKHGFKNIIIVTTNEKIYNRLIKLKDMGQSGLNIEICRAQDFL